MAWLTGYPDEEPQVLNGPGDPAAGSHATVGLLMALEHRRRTGEGALVESPMVGASLAIAAEQVIEHSAYGRLLTRDGNRGPTAAPQNLYLAADEGPTGGRDRWVAIAVETDEQWRHLCRALGREDWEADPALADQDGRRAAHALLDEDISRWCGEREADDIVTVLWDAGVPVGIAVKAEEQEHLPQLRARGFYETVQHPVVGEVVHGGYPIRFSAGPQTINRSAAPTLGQHNREILSGVLGLDDAEIDRLEAEGVIGTRPKQ
jgi:crotonobetainyl-CoA:carnitine CoA-transferase CaiB-like acyl-CoA transferase